MNGMANCHDIDPLVTPFIDGEAAPADRASVAAHLETCAGCRERVQAEEAARGVLRSRAAALVGKAPDGLRARCAAATGPAAFRPATWRTAASLSLAAVLVLALSGVVAYGLFGRTSAVLAAQLTLDHLKCFSFSEASAGPGDPALLEGRLLQAYGWRLTIPPASSDGRLKLVGARRCVTADGGIAHILYRYDGHPISLFVLPSTERPAGRVELFGYRARIWSRGGATYVIIAGQPGPDEERAASYLQTLVR